MSSIEDQILMNSDKILEEMVRALNALPHTRERYEFIKRVRQLAAEDLFKGKITQKQHNEYIELIDTIWKAYLDIKSV